ncbi:MAG: protein kinase domain-containing protein [Planctomycetales bacterium]
MPCPPRPELLLYLQGRLNPDHASGVERHVSGCCVCQEMLESLTQNPDLRHQLITGWSVDFRNAPRTGGSDNEVELSFLAAAREPGDLGMLDDYRIYELLGTGGMGLVFHGYDSRLERQVAIKVLRPERSDPSSRRRFIQEGQAMARIRDDHVVGVFAVVDPAERPPYLVMEHLDGPTLARHIADAGRLPALEAARIVIQVAGGLAAAHAKGLIHRDVKPANIMFDRGQQRWKLMDFGLAHNLLASAGESQAGLLAGTPAYMSPEQAQGTTPAEPRSDVYGLGLTLYEALTGEVPFRGDLHLVLQQIVRDEPRRPAAIAASIPRDVEVMCLKAIAKDASRRYVSAAQFQEDLRRWERGEPIIARPAGRSERVWRWARRNRLVAGLTMTLALVGIVSIGGLWSLWQAALQSAAAEREQSQETARQRAEAEDNLNDALAAIDQFSLFVLDEEQLKKPELAELRRNVARRWAENYARVLERRENDPKVLESLADGHTRIAQALMLSGTTKEAAAGWTEAVRILKKLDAQTPNRVPILERLARALLQLGQYPTGADALADSERALEEALQVSQRVVELEPDLPTHRFRVVTAQGAIARLATMRSDHQAALASIQAVRDEIARMVALQPAHFGYQQNLGVAEHNLGLALTAAGAPDDEARHALERAREIRQRLIETMPSPSHWDFANLANTDTSLGLLWQGQGNLNEAMHCLERAIALREQVQELAPGGALYAHSMVNSRRALAQVLDAMGMADRSVAEMRSARETFLQHLEALVDGPALPVGGDDPLMGFCDFSIRQGDAAEAVQLADVLFAQVARRRQEQPDNPEWQQLEITALSRRAAAAALQERWVAAAADLELALTHKAALRNHRGADRPASDASDEDLQTALEWRWAQARGHCGHDVDAQQLPPSSVDAERLTRLKALDPGLPAALDDASLLQALGGIGPNPSTVPGP